MQVDILDKPVEYNEVIKLFDNKEKDKCFILEHNDIYTAGKSDIFKHFAKRRDAEASCFTVQV